MSQNLEWAKEYVKAEIERHFGSNGGDIQIASKRVIGHINQQARTKADYAGRVLLELIQNVDDAAVEGGPECQEAEFVIDKNSLRILNQGKPFNKTGLIAVCISDVSTKANNSETTGAKGIGFRGVLNWASDIRIYSGDFAIQFSKAITRQYLDSLKTNEIYNAVVQEIGDISDKYPILTLPGSIQFPKEWRNGKFNEFYDTCIELQLNNDKLELVRTEIQNFINNELVSVLFLRAIKVLKFTEIIGNETITTVIKVEKNQNNPDGHSITTIKQQKNGTEDIEHKFHIFSSGSESIAVPFDKPSNSWPLYCTFPINKEPCPFPVIMNSTRFSVQSNRELLENSSEQNLEIIENLKTLFINSVLPYFAKSEYGTLAIDLLKHDNLADNKFFNKNLDKFYETIKHQPIIPTKAGTFTCLTDNLKSLPYLDYPQILIQDRTANIVSQEVVNKLSFAPILQAEIHIISVSDLYELINSKSAGWSITSRINVLWFWLDVVKVLDLMPKLLKTTDDKFYFFDKKEHEHIFFYTGKVLQFIPEWVPFLTIHDDDKAEIFKQYQAKHNFDSTKELDRKIAHDYENVFKYMDKNSALIKINSSVDGKYERAIDLIKCIYDSFNDDIKSIFPGDTSWNFPASTGDILPPAKLYFGSDYGDTIGTKICEIIGLVPLPSPKELGLESTDDTEIDNFKAVLKKFGVRDTIIPHEVEVSWDKLDNDYRNIIEKQLDENVDYSSIKNVKIKTVQGLSTILTKANQDLILEWINQIRNSLHQNYVATVTYRRKHGKYDQETYLPIPDFIYFTLRKTAWIDLGDRKIPPQSCLCETNKYPEGLVNIVPQYDTYQKVWDFLNITNNVCFLPQNDFYDVLLKLPSFDKNGKISMGIYRDIAKTSADKLTHLLNEHTGYKKQQFFSSGRLWVKTDKYSPCYYHPVSQGVYFTNKKVLNLSKKPIMETPLRSGSIKDFKAIFNAYEFKEDVVADYIASVRHPENEKFEQEFEHFKKYIIALAASDKLTTATPGLKISLVKEIVIKDDKSHISDDLEDYSTISTDRANKYFIKVSENMPLDKNKLADAIAEICDAISASANIVDAIHRLYIGNEEDRKRCIINNGGNPAILDDYKDIKKRFVEILRQIAPTTNIEELLAQHVINFTDFSSIDNAKSIINILKIVNTNVPAFEARDFWDIDLKSYNQQLWLNYLTDNTEKYKSNLYNELKNKSRTEQETFFARLNDFKNKENDSDIPNTHDFDPSARFAIHSDGPDVSIDDIYMDNYKKLLQQCPEKDVLEDILSSSKNKSLLLFWNIDTLVEQYNNIIKQRTEELHSDKIIENTNPDVLEIKNYTENTSAIKVNPVTHIEKKTMRGQSGVYNPKRNEQKQQAGFDAELEVYQALCKKYPGTVKWCSGNAVKAHVTHTTLASDALGYDIEYKDNQGNKKYAEVKSATYQSEGLYSFIISNNEENFARTHLNQYAIFLVIDKKSILQISGTALKERLDNKNSIIESRCCYVPYHPKDEKETETD